MINLSEICYLIAVDGIYDRLIIKPSVHNFNARPTGYLNFVAIRNHYIQA